MTDSSSPVWSDSFTFIDEPWDILAESELVPDGLLKRYKELACPYNRNCRIGDVHRKRDVLKTLIRQPEVVADTWKIISYTRSHLTEDFPQSRQWLSILVLYFSERKAQIRNLRHLAQQIYEHEGEPEHCLRNGLGPELSIDFNTYSGALSGKALDMLDDKLLVPKHERYNRWRIGFDDAFAMKYLKGIQSDPRLQSSVIRYCHVCETVGFSCDKPEPVNLDLSDLIASAKNCDLCSLISRSVADVAEEDGSVHLFRAHATLRAGSGGKRLLRFSTDKDFVGRPKQHIPIGRPLLPDCDSTARFQLLCAWLHECDKHHHCNNRKRKTDFPTRLLDVGCLEDRSSSAGWIRLTCPAERISGHYVALSHRWGSLTDAQKNFCTTQSNLLQRRRGFGISELPQTFKDAIEVTRAVGVRYLWIDSLCIVQSGDGGNDWDLESEKMKDIFSQAYFVMAATAARDSYSGFLSMTTDRTVQHVCVQDGPSRHFYISTDIDAYDDDVEKAGLNSRAWVKQESVLARRTVHFSTNQMYWECGKGLYCENLTRLKSMSRGKSFEMDPEFPKRVLEEKSITAIWNSVSFLFEDYSQRDVTCAKDRPRALRGLVDCVADTFFSKARFSTFERFLHRGLLWYTSSEKATRWDNDGSVPSWSWVSCSGRVGFIREEAHNGCIHLNKNLEFHEDREEVLIADLGAFFDCTIDSGDERCSLKLLDDAGREKGWLRPDVKDDRKVKHLHCIVIGKKRSHERFLVVAVVPKADGEEYRRFGMGEVDGDCVVKVQDKVYIV